MEPMFSLSCFYNNGRTCSSFSFNIFQTLEYKQAHPLVQCVAGNHGYLHNAPRQESGDINLLLQTNSAHMYEIH